MCVADRELVSWVEAIRERYGACISSKALTINDLYNESNDSSGNSHRWIGLACFKRQSGFGASCQRSDNNRHSDRPKDPMACRTDRYRRKSPSNFRHTRLGKLENSRRRLRLPWRWNSKRCGYRCSTYCRAARGGCRSRQRCKSRIQFSVYSYATSRNRRFHFCLGRSSRHWPCRQIPPRVGVCELCRCWGGCLGRHFDREACARIDECPGLQWCSSRHARRRVDLRTSARIKDHAD